VLAAEEGSSLLKAGVVLSVALEGRGLGVMEGGALPTFLHTWGSPSFSASLHAFSSHAYSADLLQEAACLKSEEK